jgi:cell division protein FtsB
LAAEVAARAEEKAALQRQVELLDPAGVDPDLADELVRRNLNVVKPDEVIVPLEPEK